MTILIVEDYLGYYLCLLFRHFNKKTALHYGRLFHVYDDMVLLNDTVMTTRKTGGMKEP